MSFKAVSNVMDYAPIDITSSEMLVLIILADHTNDDTWECWPSIESLSKKTRLSRSTVIRTLNKLASTGQIKIFRRKGESGVVQSSKYVLAERYRGVGYQSETLGCQNDTVGEGVTMTPKPIIDPIEKLDTNVSIKKFQNLLDLWREIFPEKPQPRITNKTLQGKFNTRLKGAHFKDNYEQALRESGKSSFLRGSAWFDLSWFLKNDDNYEKCLNGKYADTRPFSPNGQHNKLKTKFQYTGEGGRM